MEMDEFSYRSGETPELTPKQQYEARKAERKKLAEMDANVRAKTETVILLDMVDRFVTAAERIADAMEHANELRR